MTVTRSSRTPAKVLYYPHEPRLKQQHFPARSKFSRPSTKTKHRQFLKATRQSTLTQLEYVTSSFDSRRSDSAEEESDFEEPATKRRKLVAKKENVEQGPAQATLTQIGWPHGISSDEEAEEVAENTEELCDGEFEINGAESTDGPVDHTEMGTPMKGHMSHLHFVNVDIEDGLIQAATQEASLAFPPYLHGGDQIASHPLEPESPIFKTPSKPIRMEIPSSQSPDATPIKEHESTTPIDRTPLHDIPKNVLAQRDATPTPSYRKNLIIQYSEEMPESTAEEKENTEIEAAKGHELKASISSLNTCFTPARPASIAPSPGIFTPETKAMSTDILVRSPSPSPRPFSLRKTQFVQPLTSTNRHPSQTLRNTIRPSQATTVDLTQPTPKRSQFTMSGPDRLDNEQTNKRCSSPKPYESQYQFSAFSVFTEVENDDMSLGLDMESQCTPLLDSSTEGWVVHHGSK